MSISFSPHYTSRLTGEGEFRLLTVQPELGEDQRIQSEAANKGITNSATHYIRCDGNAVLITKNLHDILQRMFWIDSICINQRDEIERTSQVSLMASIYQSADKVIAWLGEADIYTEDAFSLIRAMGALPEGNLKQIISKSLGSEDLMNALGPLSNNWTWTSMKQLWRCNYFKRAWIIQDIALAKKILVNCGEYILDWDHIFQVSRISSLTPWKRVLNMEPHDQKDRVDSAHTLPLYLNSNRKLVFQGKHCHLLYILIKARRFQCADPRDKVYALLGLLGDQAKVKMRPQPVYKDCSFADTYSFTAIQILEDTNDLLLLAHAEGQDFQNIEDLPSWVPDWSCEKGLGLGITGYTRFAATASLPRFLMIDESNRSLVLHGLWLDRIVEVGESKDDAINHRDLAYFPSWISILSALPPRYHTGQATTEVFWRTLITDTAAPIFQPARHPAADEFKFAFCNKPISMEKRRFLEGLERLGAPDKTGLINDSDCSPLLPHTDSSDLPDAGDYEVHLNYSSQTRLVRTNNNYLSLATTSVRENDSVWIVAGFATVTTIIG
ncbi:heterokaryon incompatibility protein-domain-containing protein [Aspergillus alliaceus]|uniref:Heterokaryon incompatibility protein-domain-containing protein n=1 Tax=Petromyces alliaceus TaxID=209559 RepID=A0A5N7CC38_PETAA|nr:heterokaryon incompatibility protein-domain-containing protein [Aspergillus alliaceus]